ncbi:MAG: hypothetical protein Q4F26_02645 [Atopococcus tabaci]|uniref:DUF2273 domain-containing protein n=1 Tax=Atopococcus tabaci TaxID=269774 RepID=A0AA43ZSG4_9LACT|nr:hypothetical protein [Atopococcus tabaci]
MRILLGFIIGAIIGWFVQDWLVGFSIGLGLVLMWEAVEWFIDKNKK